MVGIRHWVARGMLVPVAFLFFGCGPVVQNNARVVKVEVTPSNEAVATGTSLQFTATAKRRDGTTGDITAIARWTSSDPAVAAFDDPANPGLVLARAPGKITVTATEPRSGVAGSAVLQVKGSVLVSLAVTPATPSIALGTTQQFTATGTFSDNSTQDLTTDVTWSSDTGVAIISNAAGSEGLATSAAAGSTSITATHPGTSIAGSTVLTVTQALLVSLAVTPANPSIAAGTAQQFAATGTFSDNSTQDLTAAVTWSSSDTGVATVSNAAGSQGLATSAATGTTSITATEPGTGIAGSMTLQVTPAVLVSLAVTPANPSIALGMAQQFTATGTYSDNSTQDLTTAITWSSADTGVATVSNAAGSQGLATSAAIGSTSITATDPGTSIAGSTAMTVTPAVLVSLAVTPANPSIAAGTAQQFAATGTFSDNSTQDLTTAVTWSSDTGAATISNAAGSHGLATSAAVGSALITATDPETSITGSTVLTVTPAVLVSLAVTPANPSIALGTAQQFAATGTFTDNSTQDLTTAVTWSSSDTGVATISNAAGSQGFASSAATGSTSILATDPGTSIAGSTGLTVTPAVLVSLAVTPANPYIVLGVAQQFTATGTFSDNSTQDLTTAITWSSADTGIATVSNAAGSQGLATSAGIGSTSILATDPGTSIAGSATLVVLEPITFVAASSGFSLTGVLSLTLTTPAGTMPGDVMIASIAVRPNPTVTPPAGWNFIRRMTNTALTENSLLVYWRVATESEPASYVWTFASSTGTAGGISAFRNVDTDNPIDIENGQTTANSLSHATPSIVTTLAGTMIVTSHAYSSSSTWTPPAGMTESFDVRSQVNFGSGGVTLCGARASQSAAGATGTRTAVADNSADTGNTHILALRRALP